MSLVGQTHPDFRLVSIAPRECDKPGYLGEARPARVCNAGYVSSGFAKSISRLLQAQA